MVGKLSRARQALSVAAMLEELLGGVSMTSTVSGPGVTARGYARREDGSWRWSGTLAEMLKARRWYWIRG